MPVPRSALAIALAATLAAAAPLPVRASAAESGRPAPSSLPPPPPAPPSRSAPAPSVPAPPAQAVPLPTPAPPAAEVAPGLTSPAPAPAAPSALAPLAPGPAAPPPRPDLDTLRARLPEQVEAFRRVDVSLHPAASGEPDGLVARYRSRRAEASLFLYGFPDVAVPDGTEAPSLRGELELDGDDLRDQLRAGRGPVTEGEAEMGYRGTNLLLCRTFRSRDARGREGTGREGATRSDWLCLGGAAGRTFKLHVTARHAPAAAREMLEAVSRFAVALQRDLAGGPPG